MSIARIKKGDEVIVISGAYAGRTGKVNSVDPDAGTAIVAGVNMRTHAVRRSQENPNGGLVKAEAPIRLCKLMPYDAEKKAGVRVRTGEKDGKKARVSVKSGKAL